MICFDLESTLLVNSQLCVFFANNEELMYTKPHRSTLVTRFLNGSAGATIEKFSDMQFLWEVSILRCLKFKTITFAMVSVRPCVHNKCKMAEISISNSTHSIQIPDTRYYYNSRELKGRIRKCFFSKLIFVNRFFKACKEWYLTNF